MVDFESIKFFIEIICGPFGAVVLMGAVLVIYDKRSQTHQIADDERAQKREEAERASRKELATTFEKTVAEILLKAEMTQRTLIERAETTERLCEARYTILLQQVINTKT